MVYVSVRVDVNLKAQDGTWHRQIAAGLVRMAGRIGLAVKDGSIPNRR